MSDCPTADESCQTVPQQRSHFRLPKEVTSDCRTAQESCPTVPMESCPTLLQHTSNYSADFRIHFHEADFLVKLTVTQQATRLVSIVC